MVLHARRAQRDRVLGVVPLNARCAGVISCRGGAVMRWAIAVYGLDRVHASCDAENIGSYRVMEKLGMRREALLRQHRLLRGERRDELVYGILASELSQTGPA